MPHSTFVSLLLEKLLWGSMKILPKSGLIMTERMEIWRLRRPGSLVHKCRASIKVLVFVFNNWKFIEPGLVEDLDVRNGPTRLYIVDERQVHGKNPFPKFTNSANGGPIEDAVCLALDVWQLTLPQLMILLEHWLV